MHEDIIQISTTPLEEGSEITYDSIPEWFVGSIADYIGDERDTDGNPLGYVAENYPFKIEGDYLVIDEEKVTKNLKREYDNMVENAKKLSEMSFEDFKMGKAEQSIYNIEEDRFTTYVAETDADGCVEEFMTLDRWIKCTLRNSTDREFYVGVVLDYHW